MFEMIHQFKADINHAIAGYEQDFTDANPMSITRAHDIIDIKGLLQQSYTHVDDCSQVITKRLQAFKTGWWIFETGNSRLRDAILAVMDDYAKPSMRLLFSKFQTLENQASTFEERCQRQQTPTSSSRIAHTENNLHNKPSVNASTHPTQNKDKLIEQLQQEIKRLQLALKQSQRVRQQQVILLRELRKQQEATVDYTKRDQPQAFDLSRKTQG